MAERLNLRLRETHMVDGVPSLEQQVEVIDRSGNVLGVLPCTKASYRIESGLGSGRLTVEVRARGEVDVNSDLGGGA